MLKKLSFQTLQVIALILFSFMVYSQELESSLVWNEKDISWLGENTSLSIEANRKVGYFIKNFQTKGKRSFTQSLVRGEKYLPLMREIFQKMEVPEELVYLALVESGFDHHANYRTTCGPWQFTSTTAREYGLKINSWIDERKNPEKSTLAAAQYLKDLYQQFGCWCLALAGYNAGEDSIRKALRIYGTRDFWQFKEGVFLKKQTLNIVPKSIAAALIAKQPGKYGISIQNSQTPFSYEKIKISQATDLRAIARIAEVDLRELRDLNPELKKLSTPPDYPEYELKVPVGKKEILEKNFAPISHSERSDVR
jgi:membrane-bound lytic murein transglycosylase D